MSNGGRHEGTRRNSPLHVVFAASFLNEDSLAKRVTELEHTRNFRLHPAFGDHRFRVDQLRRLAQP
ncbi:hypothetical protein CEE69_02730 [Rhodopirellula bahusiensis]|uniref:Uncharacterized protein n=1 Tax=Rhodopirellula bahusiensis TaxID=2014065 RepID=A0A2G1WCG7_9BACT|nr:hypothetical protein CEE69_02730 [Rhodopirellula bahusiensis]